MLKMMPLDPFWSYPGPGRPDVQNKASGAHSGHICCRAAQMLKTVAAMTLRRLTGQYPEVGPNRPHFNFKGRGQRDTPATDAKGIVEVVMLLGGQQAARVRRQAAELLCRYLGG